MHPLYAWLLNKTDKKPIEWNFAKFLVAKDGKTVTNPFGDQEDGTRNTTNVARYSDVKASLTVALDMLEAAVRRAVIAE